MRRFDLPLLFCLGLLTAGASALFQSSPGYMDADYYFMGGLRLVQGQGFTEQVLWNYLDDPAGLPHPSHGYWMPLASVLAAGGNWLVGSSAFSAGRLPFLAVAALVPPLTALLSWELVSQRRYALLAGVLAAFPSFYLPFLSTTDTFGIYMVLGAGYLLILGKADDPVDTARPGLRALLLGVLAGLMHLARADGILWLGVGWIALGLKLRIFYGRSALLRALAPFLRTGLVLAIGYFLVMGPWLLRNQAVFGSPLAPGGARALFLTGYDELFSYPATELTAARWWDQGIRALLAGRLQALMTNLGSTLAVQGQIYLLPLVLLGGWACRRDLRLQVGLVAWTLTFLGMTLAFPFPGSRGGFFHSGAALQPLFWALAPVGLGVLVGWGKRRRGWNPGQAWPVLAGGLIVFAVALTWTSVKSRVAGGDFQNPAWNASARAYEEIELELVELGAAPDEVVLVNNPPGYYLASGRPAIVIPNGGVDVLLAAADRYETKYVLLEVNHPAALEPLYRAPGSEPRLELLRTVGGIHILMVMDDARNGLAPLADPQSFESDERGGAGK